MSNQVVRAALVGLDDFTALTALGGGLALATGLEGDRFPVELVRGTPFRSYLVPGLVLAGVVGGSAVVATAAMFRAPRLGAQASMGAGAVLMGWIAGEVLILPASARTWWEAGYCGVALLMTGLAFLLGAGARSRTAPPEGLRGRRRAA